MPFKRDKPLLLNYHRVVKQRQSTLGLKRRHEKERSFIGNMYTSSMTSSTKLMQKEIPQYQLESGQLWNIPHYEAYHPGKNTSLVLFDFAVTFTRTSLNSYLVQRPNLTRSLFSVLMRSRQEPVALMGHAHQMFYQVKVV